MYVVLLILVLVFETCADVYLHNPRGSNNRLNEQTATRTNANRLFDSQNNNRGGYNVGDATSQAAGINQENQYRMKYFASGPYKSLSKDAGKSYLAIEWTNQHGCGGNEDSDPQKQNCNLVLQFMCQDDDNTAAGSQNSFRDGGETTTQTYQQPQTNSETQTQRNARRNNSVSLNRGLQESFDWYDSCYIRERNKGLFTADQILGNNNLGYSNAIRTRQNPNGNRNGYECPEERDYFPYWHPTPWKDIAVLAENASMCSHYKSGSFNVQSYSECVQYHNNTSFRMPSRWNNEADCVANKGTWVLFSNYLEKRTDVTSEVACNQASLDGIQYRWAVPYDAVNVSKKECLVPLDAPDCMEAPWSRSNHLGNGMNGEALNYVWTLPYFPSKIQKRCMLRLRYNISTDDYDPYYTNSSHNAGTMQKSVIEQNPYIQLGSGNTPLRLAINTAQYGRTFQDRSHVFLLRPRPAGLTNERIFNLNVRGKRGNIVQVYPAVEYDFYPTNLQMKDGDLVHVQWTGSNTHNNQEPAGDSQAGDAGEGQTGTDRNNLLQTADRLDNFPLPFEKTNMWQQAQVRWIYSGNTSIPAKDLAINMASSGYYECIDGCPKKANGTLNNLLNNAPASYEGAVLKFQRGTYHYLCTRNNNFSNRSQKGTIIVQ